MVPGGGRDGHQEGAGLVFLLKSIKIIDRCVKLVIDL